MKVYDYLVNAGKFEHDSDTRTREGRIYSWCHQKNAIYHKKNIPGHWFVFSNKWSNHMALFRSPNKLKDFDFLINVEYEIENYDSFIAFQGNGRRTFYIQLLSTKARRIPIGGQSALMKKVSAQSKSNNRSLKPINIIKTEFFEVDSTSIDIFNGIGARKSYGCGLVIPSKVYTHLCNFVVR
jgi:hypothetical protein